MQNRALFPAVLILLPAIALLAACSSAPAPAAAGGSTASAPANASSAPTTAASVDWWAKSYPTFASQTFSGSGNGKFTLPTGATAGALVASHTGSGQFIVDAAGATNYTAIYTAGAYSGTTAYGVGSIIPITGFTVQGSGSWKVVVEDVDALPTLPSSGTGAGAFKYAGPAKSDSFAHDDANGYLVVNEFAGGTVSKLTVNLKGKKTSTGTIAAGPSVVTVNSYGKWAIG